MFPPSWKSNIENEGRFDFGKVILKRQNVISISTPFKVQVTGYWRSSGRNKLHRFRRFLRTIHRSHVHRLKRKIHFYAPLVECVMKKPILMEKFKASLRRRLAAKTRLASQVLKKIKLALHDFRIKKLSFRWSRLHPFSTMCWMTIRLKKEYFDSEETLSISFIIFTRSILAMRT